jgi:hypothetical protein
VRTDIRNVLRYVPVRPLTIVMHDSFNPDCREGILTAGWEQCPYVHFLEVDFMTGCYHPVAFDTAGQGTMFGGFAVAQMMPFERNVDLYVHRSNQNLFDRVVVDSAHRAEHR